MSAIAESSWPTFTIVDEAACRSTLAELRERRLQAYKLLGTAELALARLGGKIAQTLAMLTRGSARLEAHDMRRRHALRVRERAIERFRTNNYLRLDE